MSNNKETDGYQGVGATAFDHPNSQHPYKPNKIYYGNQHVPHPTNARAKVVNHAKVMEQVLRAK